MINKVKLTILSENRVTSPHLIAEQGLAIFIETPAGNILFDTGQTDALIHNADILNIPLQKVDYVVLSHGHYDHTGGLPYIAELKKPLPVICHPALINKKYRVFPAGNLDIGIPWEKNVLARKGVEFQFHTHPFQIFPDIWFSGEIPRNNNYETIDETYQQRVLESLIHDELHDDAFLALNTVKGLVVLFGCGHAGPVNSLKHAMRITHNHQVYAIIGGMHLQSAEQQKINAIVLNLEKINPDLIFPLHCTGFTAIHKLFSVFKDRVQLLNVGDQIEIS